MKRLVIITLGLLASLVALQRVQQWNTTAPSKSSKVRVVSLAPHLTSILFEVGAGAQVVGVTRYCDDPVEAMSREIVGDFINPSFEKIVRLEPDIVLVEKWQSSRTADRLRALGLRVEEFDMPVQIEDVYTLIQSVADLVGLSEGAKDQVAQMRDRVEEVRRRGSQLHEPSLYIEIDLPTWTVGARSFTSHAIDVVGARNIFGDLQRPASQVSEETILARNPEVILSFIASAEQIRARNGWENIDAVQRNWVIDNFDPSLLSRASHRLVDGMEALQRELFLLLEAEE